MKKTLDYLVISKQADAINNIAIVKKTGYKYRNKSVKSPPISKKIKLHKNTVTKRIIIAITIKIRGSDFAFFVSTLCSMLFSRLHIRYLLINKSFLEVISN